MSDESRYEVDTDSDILKGGFSNLTPYQVEYNALVEKYSKYSDKSQMVTLLLWLILGPAGAHRYYVGKWKSGLLYTCTLGICGIGWILDFFSIVVGRFKDADGRFVNNAMNAKFGYEVEALKKKYNRM